MSNTPSVSRRPRDSFLRSEEESTHERWYPSRENRPIAQAAENRFDFHDFTDHTLVSRVTRGSTIHHISTQAHTHRERERAHALNNTRKEEAAFTRIPADLSRPPLRSARLTLRRASLQVGHATTHRSTLGMSLSLPLLHLRASPFPPSTTTTGHVARYRHYHRRAPESPPPECHSTFSFAAVRLPRLSRHPSPPDQKTTLVPSPRPSLSLFLVLSPRPLAASLAMPYLASPLAFLLPSPPPTFRPSSWIIRFLYFTPLAR